MRYLHLYLLLAAWVLKVEAQDVVAIYSDKDAVIGYHYQLNSENTNYNYADWFGALSQPGTQGGENHSRSLIYFDLSALPPGTLVDEALLDLYGVGPVGLGAAASVGNIGTNSCWLEQITEPWEDNTVTWNTRPATTSMNAILLPSSTQTIEDYVGMDVTGMVQAMINNPNTAHGFALRTEVESPTRGLFFCGAGFSDPSKRPRLRIKFSRTVSTTENATMGASIAYPNPVQTGTPLQLFLPSLEEVDVVVIFDSNGRIVDATRVGHSARGLLVKDTLAPGLYRIVVKNPKGTVILSSCIVVTSG
ncbi:MAG: DNRLRE domain-containing protein [Flavobacteriales bacterium]|nr:DNRLRE domain-containing protein [Flavobacteriales bacterium]